MLAGPVAKDASWQHSAVKGGHRYTSAAGSVTVLESPWHVEIRDANGTLLTKTDHSEDNKTSFTPILPFSYVRRGADYSRSFNAVFTLSPGEQIFGCGETFTGLRQARPEGRALDRPTRTASRTADDVQAHPVFHEQSRAYGMFLHTSTPVTCDFGHSIQRASTR
jgi:alpha-D-xyloside xylohydrolase